MKKEEARRKLQENYEQWLRNKENRNKDIKIRKFCWYGFVEKYHSNLLDFKHSNSDQWQAVNIMVRDYSDIQLKNIFGD